MSTPAIVNLLANVWRSVCGVTSLSPAFLHAVRNAVRSASDRWIDEAHVTHGILSIPTCRSSNASSHEQLHASNFSCRAFPADPQERQPSSLPSDIVGVAVKQRASRPGSRGLRARQLFRGAGRRAVCEDGAQRSTTSRSSTGCGRGASRERRSGSATAFLTRCGSTSVKRFPRRSSSKHKNRIDAAHCGTLEADGFGSTGGRP
jgi:hypothetical protein